MKATPIIAALAAVLMLHGCSSKPRQFTPKLTAAPDDQGSFDAAHAECRQLLADGKLDSSGRLASGGAGAAAGATTLAVGGVAAATTGGYAGLAVASATIVALPFVAVAGAWGLAKAKKKKKEKRIQLATAGCLHERGYEVAGWSRAKKQAALKPKQAAVQEAAQ